MSEADGFMPSAMARGPDRGIARIIAAGDVGRNIPVSFGGRKIA